MAPRSPRRKNTGVRRVRPSRARPDASDLASQGTDAATVAAVEQLIEERAEELTALERTRIARLFFALLLVASIGLIGMMIWPFFHAVIFALIIAGSFFPLMDYLTNRRGMGRMAAASIVTVTILVCVFLPLIYIFARLAQEAAALYQYLSEVASVETLNEIFFSENWVSSGLRRVFTLVNVQYTPEQVQAMLLELLKYLTSSAVGTMNSILSNVLDFLFQTVVMLIMAFAILLEGPRIKAFLIALSPLPDEETELLLSRFNQMNYVTMVCNGLGGVIQGGLAGVAFWLAGFQSVVLWTVVMAILAFIPVIGMSVVYVPASIFLLYKGQYVAAVSLFVFCSLVALVTENWFKPIFMGSSIELNGFLVLFAIIGGMGVFGPAGIFYGPVIVILFMTIVDLYHQRYAQFYARA
jgi:predicted PurR-regulated permease PerM